MKFYNPSKEFIDYATSFAGCDGGDLTEEGYWYCGIEFGQGFDKLTLSKKINTKLTSDLNKLNIETIKEDKKYPFFRGLYQIHQGLTSDPNLEYETYVDCKTPRAEGTKVINLNLYPIAFKSTDPYLWMEWHSDITGFPSKAAYISWCQQHRFPLFRSLTERYKPQVIVCSGLSKLDEFLFAFENDEFYHQKLQSLITNSQVITKTLKKSSLHMVWLSTGTLLVVTPFFGCRHFNKKEAFIEVGSMIKKEIGAKINS